MKFPLFLGQSNAVNVVDFDQKLLLRHKNIYVSLNARIKLITFEIFVENKCDLCLPQRVCRKSNCVTGVEKVDDPCSLQRML